MLPSAVVMLFAGPIAGWLGERFGSKLPLLIGTSLATGSFVFLAFEHSTHLSIYVASALLGIGVGFSFAAMANLIVGAVDQRQTGVATGINTIMRTIGGSLGGQVAASVVGGSVAGQRPARRVGLHHGLRDRRRGHRRSAAGRDLHPGLREPAMRVSRAALRRAAPSR